MASLNFKQNFPKGFKQDALLDDVAAVGAGVVYRVLPSLFGMQGWPALLVGFSVPYIAGKAFDIPGMSKGACGCLGAHLIQFAEPQFEKLTGNKFWPLGTVPATDVPTLPDTTTVNDRMSAVVRPGDDVYMYQRQAIDAIAQNPMNDIVSVDTNGRLVNQGRPVVDADGIFSANAMY